MERALIRLIISHLRTLGESGPALTTNSWHFLSKENPPQEILPGVFIASEQTCGIDRANYRCFSFYWFYLMRMGAAFAVMGCDVAICPERKIKDGHKGNCCSHFLMDAWKLAKFSVENRYNNGSFNSPERKQALQSLLGGSLPSLFHQYNESTHKVSAEVLMKATHQEEKPYSFIK